MVRRSGEDDPVLTMTDETPKDHDHENEHEPGAEQPRDAEHQRDAEQPAAEHQVGAQQPGPERPATEQPTATAPPPRRLYRSRGDRVIAGVCGGIARYFNVDPVLVRVGAVALVFLGGAGLLAYIAAVLLIPNEGEGGRTPDGPNRGMVIAGAGLLGIAGCVGIPLRGGRGARRGGAPPR